MGEGKSSNESGRGYSSAGAARNQVNTKGGTKYQTVQAGGSTYVIPRRSSNESGQGYSSSAAYDPRNGRLKTAKGNESASEMARGPGVRVGGRTGMSPEEYAARKGMAQGNQDWAYASQLVSQLPSYVDPFNGASVMDLLTAGAASSVSGGSGGGGGGYGSSGGGSSTLGPSSDLLRGSMDMQAAALDDSYNAREAVLRKLMSEQAGIYDAQRAALDQSNQGVLSALMARESAGNQLRQQQAARLSEIMNGLTTASQGAASGTATAYGNAGSELDALAAKYAQLQQQQNAGANQLAGAFGAGPAGIQGDAVQALAAARGLNTQLGAGAASSYAGRQAVYGGLQSDAQMADKQAYDQLMRQVADARTSQSAKYASDLNQLAGARSQGMSQYEMQLAQLAAERQQAAIAAAQQRAELALKYGVQL